MAKVDDSYVKKEVMYIGIGVALVVGVLIGIVYNSSQNKTGQLSVQRQSVSPAQMQSGITPDQARNIMVLEQRVAGDPQDLEAWVQLGHTYFDANRPNKAILAYEKSLNLKPNDAGVLTDLGVMYRRAGRAQDAINSFDKAIAVDPRHEQSRFNKGIVLMNDLGDVSGAISTWEGLLQVNPAARAGNGTAVTQIIADAKSKLSSSLNAGQ